MLIYFLFIFIFITCTILEVEGLKKQQSQWILRGLTFLSVLFVGLRFHTGADWNSYIFAFEHSLLKDDNIKNLEYGYIILNKVFKYLFDNYYVMQFAITSFFYIVFYKFIVRYSPYPIASITFLTSLLWTTIITSQVRQSIAIAIIILSAYFVFNRKFLLFISMIALASMFHVSAIVAFPLYFLYRNYGRVIPVTLIGISYMFYFYPEIVKSFIELISPYLPDRLSIISVSYINSDTFGEKAQFSNILYHVILNIISLCLILFKKTTDKTASFFINTLVIYLIIKSFCVSIFIFQRLEGYYLTFAIISFGFLFDMNFKRIKSINILYTCLLVLFFTFPFMRAITNTNIYLSKRPFNDRYVPYYNSLFHPPKAANRLDWNE